MVSVIGTALPVIQLTKLYLFTPTMPTSDSVLNPSKRLILPSLIPCFLPYRFPCSIYSPFEPMIITQYLLNSLFILLSFSQSPDYIHSITVNVSVSFFSFPSVTTLIRIHRNQISRKSGFDITSHRFKQNENYKLCVWLYVLLIPTPLHISLGTHAYLLVGDMFCHHLHNHAFFFYY